MNSSILMHGMWPLQGDGLSSAGSIPNPAAAPYVPSSNNANAQLVTPSSFSQPGLLIADGFPVLQPGGGGYLHGSQVSSIALLLTMLLHIGMLRH